MRQENEVIEQILDFAHSEDRVRAVMLNGSRLNSKAPKDIMQDYDVVFFIRSLEDSSYKTNREWISRFGELVILQQNDFENGSYIFLMQFKDGIRIDLRFENIDRIATEARKDTLSKILLDKENRRIELPLPNDSIHYVQKPTESEFNSVLNNAWWIQTYVAKSLWRDELPFAKYTFDVILIDCIQKLLSWYIGEEYNWNINVGKYCKWFKNLLSEDMYNEFITLYPTVNYDEMWQSLFHAGEFIQKIGKNLAEKLQFTYPIKDDMNVTKYIQKIKVLPRESTEFK
ncbi:aminoglycoside 6-adenylyltransferase [Clostridium estertheticum]|uniref:aminoglycoside 6-adenylyltransferase n=1 Tax=Clostridium estertheticum TaxID=238834 RepID=UPI0013E96591|nr:aminoglycoside 6-adenylyltransferase [Clostridium estertheticum]MBZ9687466.1 aminoglycoside 6-adenylyltransferase [Clostridium estertheticum]